MEQLNGRAYEAVSYGSVDDLRAFSDAKREQGDDDSGVWAAYLLDMRGNDTRLDDLQAERDPDIKLTRPDQLER